MNVALLGAGEPHFDGHLKTLQVLPEVEAVHVWGDIVEAVEALEADKPAKVETVTSDLDDLLARVKPSFAIATTRNNRKPAIFARLLEADIHLMAEKPIANTGREVASLVDLAESRGLALGTCYTNRYHPVIQEARRLVAEGLIGPMMSMEIRMLTTQPGIRDPKKWLFHKEHAGGGILAWLGCHYIDLMRYITGDEIVSVQAEVATRSGEEIDVEDIAVLSLRFRSGAVGSLHNGYTMALKGERYGDMPAYDTYMGINGQLGRIYWDDVGQPSHMFAETTHEAWADSPVREFDFTVAESPAYSGVHGEAFMRDFIHAAQGKGEVPASGRDALQVARVIDGAYASSATGRRVDIEAP